MATLPNNLSPAETPPPVTDPDFRPKALAWVTWWTSTAVPWVWSMVQWIFTTSSEIATTASAAGSAKLDAEAAAAQAANSAAAAQAAVSNVVSWVSGASYAKDALTWGTAAPYLGTVYRATVAHSGQTTPPQSDSTRWAPVGANWAADPTQGRTQEEPTAVNSAGDITELSFMKDGKPGTETFTYTSGLLTQVVTVWNGSTWTTTYSYDGSGEWVETVVVRS